MDFFIGENIKRLRLAKNITQEKLAEYLNISTPAVSKWERGETLPDITMIFPLANYFAVSTDELLGYDESRIEETIQTRIGAYKSAMNGGKLREGGDMLVAARKEFPNDFRIMTDYMYYLLDGGTDCPDETVLRHASELTALCDRVFNECTVDSIRSGAINITAKVCKARGEHKKALEYLGRLGDWYTTKGQKAEQLYNKDTDEWRYWVSRNFNELAGFAVNKMAKIIWYSKKPLEDKARETVRTVEFIQGWIDATGYELAYAYIAVIYHEAGKVCNCGNLYDTAGEYYERCLHYSRKFDDFLSSNRGSDNPAVQALRNDGAGKFKSTLRWMQNTPFLNELRKTGSIASVLEKYERL